MPLFKNNLCNRRNLRINVLATNTVQISLTANENVSIRNSGRRIDRFANRIRRDDLVLWSRFNYESVTIFTRQQNLAIKCYRRGRKTCRYRYSSALIFDFTCLSIETGQDSTIRSQVKIVSV